MEEKILHLSEQFDLNAQKWQQHLSLIRESSSLESMPLDIALGIKSYDQQIND